MFYINGLEDNTIRLPKSKSMRYEFKVVSTNSDGKKIPFTFECITTDLIQAGIIYGDTLIIDVNPPLIKNTEAISLVNEDEEYLIIEIIPNEYYMSDKVYNFKATSKKILEDGSLKLKILSKVNDMEIGWECTYNGRPMSYSITPFESDKGEYVTIKPTATILNEFKSIVEFTQNESEEKITFELTNTPELGITEATKK